jgi:glycosyltransferase involved in cell wall biosynthesis
VLEQAKYLENVDLIEVVLSSGMPVTDSATVLDIRRLSAGVPRWARPPLRYADLAMLQRVWRTATETVHRLKPDVVWANQCSLITAPLLLRHLRIPSLYYCDEPRRSLHDFDAADKTNPLTRPLYAPLRRWEKSLELGHIRSATRIAANSAYTAGRINQIYGRPATVIPCGVPEFFLQPDIGSHLNGVNAVATQAQPAPTEPAHLLSVGTLIPTKGHDLAIRSAAASGLDLPLVIVAPRPGPDEAARLQVIADSLGQKLLVRVGISDSELRTTYQNALATLYLAEVEPFGLASIEAQALGSPVIVAAEGGLPETVRPDITGFVVPRTVEATAEAIRRVADPTVRQAMSTPAAAWGATFTWQASAVALRAELVAAVG